MHRLMLAGILITAAALRLTGVAWDDYHHYHPDERFITWAATTIERPSSFATAFVPHASSFNPYHWPPDAASAGIETPQDETRDFAYGHFPLYLGVIATRLVEWMGPVIRPLFSPDSFLAADLLNGRGMVEFRHLTVVTRVLTALIDVGTVLLVYLLGRRLYEPAVGLLAAAFLAVNVMHIQLAHFFTTDPYLTFFVTAALLTVSRMPYAVPREPTTENGLRNMVAGLLAAVCVGLAIGSKFAAVLLLFPLALAAWWSGGNRRRRVLVVVLAAGVTFALTNPFALLDFTCDVVTPAVSLGPLRLPALNWGSCFLENIGTQGGMVRGDYVLPFTRQYVGTWPYLYFVEMQLRWGMGPLLGLLAFAGFGWAVWQGGRDLWRGWQGWRAENGGKRPFFTHLQHPLLLLALAWCVPYFLTTGGFFVKFMRYLQPLTPFLMIFGAAFLWRLPKWPRWVVGTAVLLTTTLYALAFVNLYEEPHPWVAASEWLYTHAAPGALLLSEQWDDPLPTSLLVDGEPRRRAEFPNLELSWLAQPGAADDVDKLARNLALLAQADYVTIASNRVYGVVPRQPQAFPLSSQYHALLFSGALGYEPVFVADRVPHLWGVRLQPDSFAGTGLEPPPLVAEHLAARPAIRWGRADESFTVYDQPLTMIFRNNGRLSAAEMRAQFDLSPVE